MKKQVSMLLAVLMAATVCGCGQTNEGRTTASETESAGEASTQAEGAGEEDSTDTAASDLDMSENVTLSVIVPSDPNTMPVMDMPMWQHVCEQANVTLDVEQVKSGWDERKATVLASDDLPDIFMGGALTDADISANLDSLVELSDLIDKYAPNVTKMFNDDVNYKLSGTFDGGIYSIPMVRGFMPQSCVQMSINKEWLDNLGLDVPTNFQELEDVLVAFRDGDPNQNGDTTDEIPLDWPAETHAHDIYVLCGSYGVVDNSDDYMPVLNDGKVSFLFETDAFKEVTCLIHKWFDMGLINPAVYTQTYQEANALSGQGDYAKVGVTTGWDARSGEFMDQYIPLSVLKVSDDADYDLHWPSNPSTMCLSPNAIVISKSCKYPERAMALINLLYGEEFSVQSYYGSIPDQIQVNDDGTYTVLDANDRWIYSLCNYSVGYYSPELQAKMHMAESELTRLNQDKVYEPYFLDSEDIYPSVKFTAEELEELTYLRTDIMSLVKQKMAEWCVNGGCEEEWDSYIQSLEDMGLEDMRKIYQDAYDRAMALK